MKSLCSKSEKSNYFKTVILIVIMGIIPEIEVLAEGTWTHWTSFHTKIFMKNKQFVQVRETKL